MKETLEQEILEVWSKDITSLHSINNIAKTLKKAYPYINKKINIYLEDHILNKIVVGKSFLCYPNLENEKTRLLLSILEINNRDKHKKKEICGKEICALKNQLESIKDTFLIHTSFLHADTLIIVSENPFDTDQIKAAISPTKTVIIGIKQFQAQLQKDCSILQERISITNPEKYYEIISEIHQKIIRIK